MQAARKKSFNRILNLLDLQVSNLFVAFLPLLVVLFVIRRAECVSLLFGLYGKINTGKAYELTIIEKLSFFTDDFLFLSGVLPIFLGLAFAISFLIFGRKFSLCFKVLVINLISLIIIAEHVAIVTSGSYVNLLWLKSTISWIIISQPEVVFSPTIGTILKCIYIFLIPNLTYLISHIFLNNLSRRIISFLSLSLVFLTFIPVPQVKEGIFRKSVNAFFNFNSIEDLEYSNAVNHDPISAAKKLRQILETESDSVGQLRDVNFGIAKNYDVIFIVNETLPSEVVDYENSNEFPNASKLVEDGIYVKDHFTTFPYTNSSLYSILTSQFPSNKGRSYLQMYGSLKSNSVFSILAKSSYESAVFSPLSLSFDRDDILYTSLGAKELFQLPLKGDDVQISVPERAKADEKSFLDMLNYISEKKKQSKNYVALYLPFLGHGPWPDTDILNVDNKVETEKYSREEYLKRRTKIASFHDKLLGELFKHLEKLGTLQKTIFIVTGDHGARTSFDYPELKSGIINDISYRVPLIISAKGIKIDENNKNLGLKTTHLDVMPTVLELLGVDIDREYELGMPIWKIAKKDRPIFLFGRNYLGSDGLIAEGKSYSYNTQLDVVYSGKNGMLDFEDMSLVDQSKANKVKGLFSTVNNLQDLIVSSQSR